MTLTQLQIRSATIDDTPIVLALVRKKADFDRTTGGFDGEVQATADRIKASLFGDPAFAHALIAEDGAAHRGFALFYFRYSSFAGRPSVWLDDLYVEEGVRSRGIGARLIARLTAIAAAHDCTHLSWTASLGNPRGIAFYLRIGATIAARDDRQVTFRLAVGVDETRDPDRRLTP